MKQNPEMDFLSGECFSPLFIVQTACEQGGKLFGMMRRSGLTSWSRTRMGAYSLDGVKQTPLYKLIFSLIDTLGASSWHLSLSFLVYRVT